MSRKSAIDPEVMQTERYAALSLAAQALYPQLLMESDTMGVVVGARRVLLATGITDAAEALEELIESGYVVPIEVNGDTVHIVRHYFVNNNYQRKYTERSKFFTRLPEYIETPRKGGEVYGAPCTHRTSTVHAQAEQNREEQNREDGRGREGNRGGEPPALVPCPHCRASVTVGETANGYIHFECMECGTTGYLDTVTGEVVDNPYCLYQ